MGETDRQRQRRIDSENAACNRIAQHLRDFGYPDVTPQMIREISEAHAAGNPLPHGVIGIIVGRDLDTVRRPTPAAGAEVGTEGWRSNRDTPFPGDGPARWRKWAADHLDLVAANIAWNTANPTKPHREPTVPQMHYVIINRLLSAPDAGAAERAVAEGFAWDVGVEVLRERHLYIADAAAGLTLPSDRYILEAAIARVMARDKYAALRGTKGQAAPTPTHPTNHAPKATSADGCTELKEP